MTPRAGLRFFSQASRQSQFANIRAAFRDRSIVFRRNQTTNAAPVVEAAAPQSLLQRLWTSEVGIKTVHFWAPVMKWGVVLAGASDFLRPADKLSLTQNLALMATGSIWTRWCFVIRPQNMFLAAVNFCLFIVGTVQVSRILVWQSNQKGSTTEALKEMGGNLKGAVENTEKKAEKELA